MPRRKALGKPDQAPKHAQPAEPRQNLRIFCLLNGLKVDFPRKTPEMNSSKQPRKTIMETLKFLLQSKKSETSRAQEVVNDSVSWMHQQFRAAGVAYHYSDGGAGLGKYGYFQIKSLLKETAITLHLKIAEINGQPYVSAEVRVRGQHESILFPYFGEIGSEEGKLNILHFIADFVLSTSPDLTAL
jgi:hypothetical protein